MPRYESLAALLSQAFPPHLFGFKMHEGKTTTDRIFCRDALSVAKAEASTRLQALKSQMSPHGQFICTVAAHMLNLIQGKAQKRYCSEIFLYHITMLINVDHFQVPGSDVKSTPQCNE